MAATDWAKPAVNRTDFSRVAVGSATKFIDNPNETGLDTWDLATDNWDLASDTWDDLFSLGVNGTDWARVGI